MPSDGDAYIDVAERVLRLVRKPLSSRQIVELAYRHGLMPMHLHGATQHKTVGARLSEDILRFRANSKFFRNRPGRFFLRELMGDQSIPVEFRVPIVARRRRRSLKNRQILTFEATKVDHFVSSVVDVSWLNEAVSRGEFEYRDLPLDDKNHYPLISFAVIKRKNEIIFFRRGAYIEERESYRKKITFGFQTPVSKEDLTLFDREDHGAVQAGLTAIANDLDLEFSPEFPKFETNSSLEGILKINDSEVTQCLVAFVLIKAPDEFNPTGRRLAVGQLGWLDVSDLWKVRDEMDPLSKRIFDHFFSILSVEPR